MKPTSANMVSCLNETQRTFARTEPSAQRRVVVISGGASGTFEEEKNRLWTGKISIGSSDRGGNLRHLSVESSAMAKAIEAVTPGENHPNLLILMSDQHRSTCLGMCGDSTAVTPNLDRLARESIRFTNAYCTNPVCVPSRASIMTGLYHAHIETIENSTAFSPKHKTIADHFNKSGYLTGLIGKMHFVDGQTHGFSYKLEFNDWLQYLGPKGKLYADELGWPNSGAGLPDVESLWQDGDPWKGYRQPDGRLGHVAVGRVSELEEEDHFDSFVARESIRFLESYARRDEPFLLVSSFLKPHDPFMPAKRFADIFQPEQMKLSSTWGKADLEHLPKEVSQSIQNSSATPELKDASEARKRIAYYYGNLAQMDDCAGRVLQALHRLGLDRNTIVLYTSDHGELLSDLGLWKRANSIKGHVVFRSWYACRGALLQYAIRLSALFPWLQPWLICATYPCLARLTAKALPQWCGSLMCL